jgi:hypothetical protein
MTPADERRLEALRVSYERERETYRSLVGTIYPSICYLTLLNMREDYIALGGNVDDLPPVPSPGPDGRVP